MSPVFRRESEYTFKIYSNEEERMHIHMLYGSHEAKYWLVLSKISAHQSLLFLCWVNFLILVLKPFLVSYRI